MTENRTSARLWAVVALVLIVLSRPILLVGVNIRRGGAILDPIVLGVLVMALAFAVNWVLWARTERAPLITSALVIVFYEWNNLRDVISGVPFLAPVLVGAGLVVLALRIPSASAMSAVAIAFSLGSYVVAVPSIVGWVTGEPDAAIEARVLELDDAAPSTIVVLVLDGYGRSDVLADEYGFDNRGFQDDLARQGVTMLPGAMGNYSMTIASLSSALSLDYILPEGHVPTERSEQALQSVIGGDNTFMRSIDEAGYQVVYLESGWDGSRCGDIVDECIESSWYDEMAGVVLDSTPFTRMVQRRLGHPFSHNGVRVLDELEGVLETPSDVPRLIFAHSTIPHGPLFVGSDCEVVFADERAGSPVGGGGMTDEELSARRGFYVEQVECVNQRVAAIVEGLPDDAMVIIVGDHGPDSRGQATKPASAWTAADAGERLRVLAAVRFPEGCEDPASDATLINVFRSALRCLGAADLLDLDNQSFIYPHPPGALEVDGQPATVTPIER